MIPSLQSRVLSSGDKLRTHGHYSSAKSGTIPFITIQNLNDQQKLYLLCVGPLMIPSLKCIFLSRGDKLRTHGHYSSAKSGTIPFITIQNLHDQQKLCLLCIRLQIQKAPAKNLQNIFTCRPYYIVYTPTCIRSNPYSVSYLSLQGVEMQLLQCGVACWPPRYYLVCARHRNQELNGRWHILYLLLQLYMDTIISGYV